MKLKTYFSGTVEAAMELARKDLGPDTMIVYSRKADAENRHLGEYEVVFALDEAEASRETAPAPSAAAPLPPPAPQPVTGPDPYHRFSAEVADLRRQLERITGAISRTGARNRDHSPELAAAYDKWVDSGLECSLVQEILDEIRSSAAFHDLLRDPAALDLAITAEIGRRIRIAGEPPIAVNERRVMAFVGPPGAGKTLSLVKVAATLGLARRRPVQIISADTTKIGAPEQLRTYAAILGVPFQFVETPRNLEGILAETSERKLTLIDTPGYSPREMEETAALAANLSGLPGIEIHLVLSATTKTADLQRAVESYRVFGPNRLLFTRLDETASYGSILNTAIRSELPVSFLATGQSVPEDIEQARVAKLLGRTAHGLFDTASAA